MGGLVGEFVECYFDVVFFVVLDVGDVCFVVGCCCVYLCGQIVGVGDWYIVEFGDDVVCFEIVCGCGVIFVCFGDVCFGDGCVFDV